MKVIILAGGMGTRLSEETDVRPKPMVEVGGRPILWHIMKLYSHYGLNDFIICLGYKGYIIKEYFANYALHMSDVTFDMRQNSIKIHRNDADDWRVSLIDTGETTMTGGRLKRAMMHAGDDEVLHDLWRRRVGCGHFRDAQVSSKPWRPGDSDGRVPAEAVWST